MDAFPQLPGLLREALSAHGGTPLEICDPQTHRVYLVTEQPAAPPIDDQYVRDRLQEAEEDVTRGDVGPWSADEVRRLARRIFVERRGNTNP